MLRRWTADEIDRASVMANEGKSVVEIAEACGRSVIATKSALWRHGISAATANRRWSSGEIERAATMAEDGKPVAEIAVEFGRSERATQSALYRWGVSLATAKRPWSRADEAKLVWMYQHDGMSRAEIAKALGRSYMAVNHKIWSLRRMAEEA